MQRIQIEARANWQAIVEDLGLVWHSSETGPYWQESAYYAFKPSQVNTLKSATGLLYDMFIEAGHYVVEQRLLAQFGIPEWCHDLVCDMWDRSPPALNYGRFDLGYNGDGAPKLFEFNCDTPTSLLEAAVIQWFWKEDRFPNHQQFNALHEALLAKWKDIRPYLNDRIVHFGAVADDAGEDFISTAYMMDLAREAGLTPKEISMSDIGWGEDDRGHGRFYDLDDAEIRTLYKLYPWEWMVDEPFGRCLLKNEGRTAFIEPIWKMIWSNKAILSVLWDLYPNHPNLLWASRDKPLSASYVVKPLLGREGSNVRLFRDGVCVHRTGGDYTGASIYQGLYDLPVFDNRSPVIGSWCVDGEAVGIGIREDGLITSNTAQFVPHIVA